MWLIRTFWISLGLTVLGALTLLYGIGLVILIAGGVWYLYRVVAGLLKLIEQKPIEAPTRFI